LRHTSIGTFHTQQISGHFPGEPVLAIYLLDFVRPLVPGENLWR